MARVGVSGSLGIGFLSLTLALMLLPLSIYYVTGLSSFMVPKLALHVLYGFFGPYLYAQALGFGVLAAMLHYIAKVSTLTRNTVRGHMRMGLFGALYSSLISFFSICCAPLTIALLGILGSGPTIFLLLHSEKLAAIGLFIQALAIFLALRGLVRARACYVPQILTPESIEEPGVYHLKERPGVKVYRDPGTYQFYIRERGYRVYQRLKPSEIVREKGAGRKRRTKTSYTGFPILILLALNIVLAVSIQASPEFEEKVPQVSAGSLEVHVLDSNGQFVREGINVTVKGPVVKKTWVSNYIARFDGLPAAKYNVYLDDEGRNAQSVEVNAGKEVHIFLRLEQ